MTRLTASQMEKIKRWVFVALCLLAVATALYQGYRINEFWFSAPHVEQKARVFAANDVDDAVFIKDIGHHRGITGPLYWWHNGWHGKAFPWYWRPLTLFGFWTEYHLFGAYRFDRWQAADIAFHCLFAGVVGFFAYRVTGSRFAAPLTAIVFCNFRLFDIPGVSDFARFFTTPSSSVVLGNWKDQPEAWGALCTLAALLSGLSPTPSQPSPPGREFRIRRWWWWALGFAVASVCIKESGWLTFPMLLSTLLYTGRLREVPKAAWVAMVLSWTVLMALRASAGHNVLVPPLASDNHFGFERYLKHVVDPNLQQLTTDRWPIVAFGAISAWLLLLSRPRFPIRFLMILAAGAVASTILGLTHQVNAAAGMALLLDPNAGLPQIGIAFVEVIVLICAWRYKPVRRQAVYLYSLVLLSNLPEMAVLQPNEHMQYFMHGLQCALVVTIGLACARYVIGVVNPKMMSREPEVEAPVAV